jgi:phosphate transport system substrate-binding protein
VPIVNPKGKAVAPSMENVIDGTYQPLSRPIFIYVAEKAYARPEVKKFVEFYMKQGARLAQEVKYVPLPEKAYTANIEHLKKGKLGTVFGGSAEVGITIEELMKREAKL